MRIVVFTKDQCPNCVSAKNLLKSKNLEYIEKNVQEAEFFNELLTLYPDARQLPQIFIDEQRVGGYSGLQAALKQLNL